MLIDAQLFDNQRINMCEYYMWLVSEYAIRVYWTRVGTYSRHWQRDI